MQQVQRSGTLDETLQTIWSSYNGIKHTWCPNGWPFGNRDLNVRLLLKRNQRVVLLRRRNVLRRLVSNHISTQSNIWGLFNEEERDRLRTLRFAPMDLAETRVRIQNERDTELEYRSLLMESGISFLEIWYEDFYGPERSVHNRMGSLNEIFRFLGTSAIPASRLTPELARLFDHATMKLNSAATYRQIPGIEEVERVCGSDVTGWVFKE